MQLLRHTSTHTRIDIPVAVYSRPFNILFSHEMHLVSIAHLTLFQIHNYIHIIFAFTIIRMYSAQCAMHTRIDCPMQHYSIVVFVMWIIRT